MSSSGKPGYFGELVNQAVGGEPSAAEGPALDPALAGTSSSDGGKPRSASRSSSPGGAKAPKPPTIVAAAAAAQLVVETGKGAAKTPGWLKRGAAANDGRINTRTITLDLVSATELGIWLAQIDTFVFDLDGVIWSGSNLIPGAAETLAFLREHGKTIKFVTNNATRSRAGVKEKLERKGLHGIRESDIVTSASATAAYLVKAGIATDGTERVYVHGAVGLCEELRAVGLTVLGGDSDSGKNAASIDFDIHTLPNDVTAVVASFDPNLGFYSVSKAAAFVRYRPKTVRQFVATNRDLASPVTDSGMLVPGGGCQVRFIELGCGRDCDACCGKPSPELGRAIAEAGEPARICMVGDRLDTDMLFGRSLGFQQWVVCVLFFHVAQACALCLTYVPFLLLLLLLLLPPGCSCTAE